MFDTLEKRRLLAATLLPNGTLDIEGARGDDALFGGPGNDTILANDGQADAVDGGAGIDSIPFDSGIDVLHVP